MAQARAKVESFPPENNTPTFIAIYRKENYKYVTEHAFSMADDCIFCKILKGDVPAVQVYEDDICVVLMDKFPATKGQSLVVPKKHDDYIVDLDDETYNHLFSVAKKIAKATDAALETVRTCFVVEGFMVPHVHIRLHPSYKKHLEMHGREANDEELKDIAEKIKAKL